MNNEENSMTFQQMVDAGIDTLVDGLKSRVNLPSDVESLVEEALRAAARHGQSSAELLVEALRTRWHQDEV